MRIVATALVGTGLGPPSTPVRLVEADRVRRVDEHLWTASGTGTHAVATGRSCSVVIYTLPANGEARDHFRG